MLTALSKVLNATKRHSGRDQPDNLHLGLQPLMEAARLTRSNVAIVQVPVRWKKRPWLRGRLELYYKGLVAFVAHIRMVCAIWRLRHSDLIFVREFITPATFLLWPLVRPFRHRLYFFANHNAQWAFRSGIWSHVEGAMLRLLVRTGLRLAFYEFPLTTLTTGKTPVLTIPHPMDLVPAKNAPKPDLAEPIVGVVGVMRSEKGADTILEALSQLREEGKLKMHLVLGCPEADVRAHWQERGFEVIDTTTHEAYLSVLDRCDVVVLNYERERYFYRVSGVLADALSRRTPVASPDYPVMHYQLTEPAKVGSVFTQIEELPDAIHEALALSGPDFDEALELHNSKRDVTALTRLLDDFVSEMNQSA